MQLAEKSVLENVRFNPTPTARGCNSIVVKFPQTKVSLSQLLVECDRSFNASFELYGRSAGVWTDMRHKPLPRVVAETRGAVAKLFPGLRSLTETDIERIIEDDEQP